MTANFASLSDPIFEAIKTHLTGGWVDDNSLPLTPIRWPNPDDNTTPSGAHLVVEYSGDLYGQESIGETTQAHNRWDASGKLWVHVLVKKGEGSSEASGAAKFIADLFRGVRLLNDNLEFMEARIGEGAPGDDDGNWFMISTSIRWRMMEA